MLASKNKSAASEAPEKTGQPKAAPEAEKASPSQPRYAALGITGGAQIQRVAEPGARPITRSFLVESGAAGPGQMDRALFFATLRQELVPVCNAELSEVGRTADDCPYITRWIEHYEHQSIAHIERAMASYLGPEARDANGVIAAIVSRTRAAIRVWRVSGRVTGVPGDGALMPGGGGERSTGPQLKADGDGGGEAISAHPNAIRAQLGGGRPLDTGVRERMEQGFGRSFSGVRVHDDPAAAQLSSGLSARAFTVGQEMAFASGQYRPGTVIGDLLIAHELAHTVQQSGGTFAEKRSGDDEGPLEREADRAAIGVVGGAYGIADPTAIARQGGLRIQRCRDTPPSTATTSGPAVPRTENTPYGVYQIIPATAPAPHAANELTQAEFVRLSLAWTRVNDNSGGMRINGTNADRATMIAMFAREMGRSRTFRDLIIEITEDVAHPVIINPGRNNLGMGGFIDSWATRNVDLNDLEWLEETPPAGYEFIHGRGEAIIHWLAERRFGVTHPGTPFGPAHTTPMAAGGTQERYRTDLGQPGRTVGQGGGSPSPGLVDMVATDNAGNRTIFHYDVSGASRVPYESEYRPATPTAAQPIMRRTNNMDAQVSAGGSGSDRIVVRFSSPSGAVTTPEQTLNGGTFLHFSSPLRPIVPIQGPVTVEVFRVNATGPNTLLMTLAWGDLLVPATLNNIVGPTAYGLSLRLVRT